MKNLKQHLYKKDGENTNFNKFNLVGLVNSINGHIITINVDGELIELTANINQINKVRKDMLIGVIGKIKRNKLIISYLVDIKKGGIL